MMIVVVERNNVLLNQFESPNQDEFPAIIQLAQSLTKELALCETDIDFENMKIKYSGKKKYKYQ